jgi:hypothetical protein
LIGLLIRMIGLNVKKWGSIYCPIHSYLVQRKYGIINGPAWGKTNPEFTLIHLFRFQVGEWNNHFLQRHAPVLEGIAVVIHVIIVIVGVRKEVVFQRKDVGR